MTARRSTPTDRAIVRATQAGLPLSSGPTMPSPSSWA